MATTVYTDGACLGNPGPGGWAWAVPGGRWASGAAAHTTNQRMEVQAVLDAVTTIEGPLHIVSDSTYVVNCFRDRWWEGWVKRGWKNSQRKPVANRDLWEPLIDNYLRSTTRLRFSWVKGHSEDPMNDLVDALAVEAARTQQDRCGDRPPASVGPADDVPRRSPASGGPGTAAGPGTAGRALSPSAGTLEGRLPEGRRLAIVGLKPTELGGYQDNPISAAVRRRLVEILGAKAELHEDLVVLTGLSLGAEQLGAMAAADVGVPYVAVLPYPEPDKVWTPAASQVFRRLLDTATVVLTMQPTEPESKQAAGNALRRRDAFIYRNVAEAIAVWDHRDERVGTMVRSLHDHLGEEDVWIVEPERP